MDQNAFNILLAASNKDYKTLKSLPKINDYKIADQVEQVIRNMIIKNRDTKLAKSYPIKYRQALLDSVNDERTFEFLLKTFFGKKSEFSLDMPSYVFNKASKGTIELMVKYDIHPIMINEFSNEGIMDYIEMVGTKLSNSKIIDLLEYIIGKNSETKKFIVGNKYIEKLEELGYKIPKRKRNESDEDLLYRWTDEFKSKDEYQSELTEPKQKHKLKLTKNRKTSNLITKKSNDYEDLPLVELKKIAKGKISGYSKMKKRELITELIKFDNC